MLHIEAIQEQTLGLLRGIQTLECFENLRLVGGNSLALQLGHRMSIDLDLFGKTDIHKNLLVQELKTVGDVNILSFSDAIKTFTINNIKVDIVNYDYPWIDECLVVDGIHMASMRDIALMKLSAITNRGAKKDFIDLYYLLDLFSLDDLLLLYEKKYNDGSLFLVLKSLLYFKDAENEQSPKLLIDLSWDDVKSKIVEKYKESNIANT